jgi:hypothetical protein
MSDTSRMRDVPSLVAVTAGSTTRGMFARFLRVPPLDHHGTDIREQDW